MSLHPFRASAHISSITFSLFQTEDTRGKETPALALTLRSSAYPGRGLPQERSVRTSMWSAISRRRTWGWWAPTELPLAVKRTLPRLHPSPLSQWRTRTMWFLLLQPGWTLWGFMISPPPSGYKDKVLQSRNPSSRTHSQTVRTRCSRPGWRSLTGGCGRILGILSCGWRSLLFR